MSNLFSYIRARTSYFPMKWWWRPLCAGTKRLIGSFSASSLKQQSTGRHVAPLGHLILIPIRTVFIVTLNFAEKQQLPMSWSFAWTDRGSNIYLTRDEHASYCTTDALTKVGDLLHLIILLFLSSFLHLTFAPCTSWFRTKPLLKIKHHLNLNKTQTKISKKKVWDNEDIYKMKHTLFDKCFISTCTCINKHG